VADGLPAVREIGLPVFQKLLADGLDRNHAAAVTLLHLIAHVEDTNLLHRGGPEGAAWAKEAAGALLRSAQDDKSAGFTAVPSLEEIAELDRQFIERNLSPGGCADLLAVTLFLDALTGKA
jgi:triphosphoribosyl-dephospho-CoA synthetase